jgi:hypothetical protein
MRRSISFASLLFVVLAAACSGAADPHGLLGGGSDTTGGGHDASPEAASSSSGGSTSSSGGTSSGGPDASTVLDSGQVDTGVGIDTGTPLPEASPVETGPGPSAISCPPSDCNAPSVCCATNTGQGNTPVYKCQDANKQCSGSGGQGTILSCSSGADCHNGEVCCGDNQNGFYLEVSCQATCTGQDTQGGVFIQFCDPAAADPCPVGQSCMPSQVLSGLNVCG